MMMLLGASLLRFGFKKTFIIGITAEIIRFSSFALAEKFTGFVFLGISCHGPAFALFFTGVYIYLDSKCDAQSRSGVHQMFSLINFGLAFLFGNLCAGWMLDLCTDNITRQINFTAFWLIPAAVSVLSLILIAIFFPNKKISGS